MPACGAVPSPLRPHPAQALPLGGCHRVGQVTQVLHRSTWPHRVRTIYDEIEPSPIVCCDAWCRGVGQPLLWHNSAFWPDRLPDNLDPGSFEHEAAARQQASARARQGVISQVVTRARQPGAPSPPHLARVRRRGRRNRCRSARCMISGESVVAGSAGMAASHAPACGPLLGNVAGPNGRQQNLLSERSVECESSIPLPTICPHAGLAARRLRRRCS